MGSCRTKSTNAIYLQNLVIWMSTSQFWQTTLCSYTIRSDHVLPFSEPFSTTIFILTRRAVLSCKVTCFELVVWQSSCSSSTHSFLCSGALMIVLYGSNLQQGPLLICRSSIYVRRSAGPRCLRGLVGCLHAQGFVWQKLLRRIMDCVDLHNRKCTPLVRMLLRALAAMRVENRVLWIGLPCAFCALGARILLPPILVSDSSWIIGKGLCPALAFLVRRC